MESLPRGLTLPWACLPGPPPHHRHAVACVLLLPLYRQRAPPHRAVASVLFLSLYRQRAASPPCCGIGLVPLSILPVCCPPYMVPWRGSCSSLYRQRAPPHTVLWRGSCSSLCTAECPALHGRTTFHSSIPQLRDVWVVPLFGCRESCCGRCGRLGISLCVDMLFISPGKMGISRL